MDVSNKQVIVIFAVGIALLVVAFWAGLTLGRQSAGGEPAPVQARASQSVAAGSEPEQARYVVVVGTFGTEERAGEMTRDLRRRYFSAYTQTSDLATGERLFRVLIGPYDKRENAEQVQGELLGEGRRGVTIQKAN